MVKGRVAGSSNYKNSLLIEIVEQILPAGSDAWDLVATMYHKRSCEEIPCSGDNIKSHWHRNLCNKQQKPTGKTGNTQDRVHRCIAINRRITQKSSSGIL